MTTVSFSRYNWNFSQGKRIGAPVGDAVDLDEESEIPLVPVRRGGSCNVILAALENSGKCKVTGPPGCGKSSTFVASVARESGRPVVHLVPHPCLVGAFVSRGYPGCAVSTDLSVIFSLSCTVEAPFVLVTTYTALLARSFESGRPLVDVTMRPIYYCDECHDNDAATYVVMKQFSSSGDNHNAVFVSATLDGEDPAPLEANSQVVDEVVPYAKSSEHLANVLRKAINIFPLSRLMLMYCDEGSFRVELSREVAEKAGYAWFRLTSRTSPDEYGRAVAAAKLKKSVVCVDSSYRSGFDLPVSTVIDSCIVANRKSTDPKTKRFRFAFNFEQYQARGRLGRNPLPYETPMAYIRLDTPTNNDVAVIEGYEGVIAAHTIHAQGHELPEELRSIGLDDSFGYLADYRLLDSNTLLTNELLTVSRGQQRMGDFNPFVKSSSSASGSVYGDPLAAFARMNLRKPVAQVVPHKIGSMVNVAGAVDSESTSTQTFPLGKKSVEKCLDVNGLVKTLPVMSSKDVILVASTLAEIMNNLSCEFLAADALTKFVETEDASSRSSSQYKWLDDFHSTLGFRASEFAMRSNDLQLLVDKSDVDFDIINPREFKDIIKTLASTLITVYKSQKNNWRPTETIVDSSRQHYLGGLQVNTGYDARGLPLLESNPKLNNRNLRKDPIPEKRFTELNSTTNRSRGKSDGPNFSIKELELQVHHPSEERMRELYPNAIFTSSPTRQEYDQRRARQGSSTSGSWVTNESHKSTSFKPRAKTWKPPD